MTKKLLLALGASLVFTGVGYAQLNNTSFTSNHSTTTEKTVIQGETRVGPPFTMKLKSKNVKAIDMKGREFDVAKTLSEGRYILVDISAVWCVPCWNFHEAGTLEKLYKKYGPEGSHEIEIIWLEGDGKNNDTDAIIGKGKGTKGDWTNGDKVPYPMFINEHAINMMRDLGIETKEFPTLFFISPSGKYVRVSPSYYAGSMWEELNKLMKIENGLEKDGIGFSKTDYPTRVYTEDTQTFDLEVEYYSPKKVTLEAELAGTKVAFKDNKVTLPVPQPGKYDILIHANPSEGIKTVKLPIEILGPNQGSTIPLEFNFDDEKLPILWQSIDNDNDGYGWFSLCDYLNTQVVGLVGNLNPDALLGYSNSRDALISFGSVPNSIDGKGVFSTTLCKKIDNYLVTERFTVPANSSEPGIGFRYNIFFPGNDAKNSFEVLVSPTGKRTIADFTEKLGNGEITTDDITDANMWKHYTASLEKYKGKTIAIAIHHFSSNNQVSSSGLLIDHVLVCPTKDYQAAPVLKGSKIMLYPTRAHGQATLETPIGSSVTIFGINGNVLKQFTTRNEATLISLDGFATGTYYVSVTTPTNEKRSLALMVE